MEEIFNLPEQFGEDVFNEATMKQRLPQQTYQAWKHCVAQGERLPLRLSEVPLHFGARGGGQARPGGGSQTQKGKAQGRH